MFKIVMIAAISIFISACVDDGNVNQSNDIPYSVVSEGLQTGINSQQTQVIKNSVEYSALMSGVQLLGQTPNPDFSQSMLVGMFTTLNSCYSGSIDSVQDINGSIVITVTIESAEVCVAVLGNAYIMVSIAQSSKQVSVLFREI